MKQLSILVVIATFLGPSGDAWCQDDAAANPLRERLRRIEDKMAGIESVHCSFVQEKQLAMFDDVLVIEGEIFMQQPDDFAWHVHRPMRTRLVVRGSALQQWDEDTDRVQEISLTRNPAIESAMTQMQAWFTGQYASLGKDYEIAAVGEHKLRFVPQAGTVVAGVIAKVEVTFLEDERYIQALEIIEKSGDKTTLTFKNTELNQTLPSQAFQARPES